MQLTFVARAAAAQVLAQGEGVLGLLVPPVGGEPRPAVVTPHQVSMTPEVVGQVHLHAAEGLGAPDQPRVGRPAGQAVPGDVGEDVPAPGPLRTFEERHELAMERLTQGPAGHGELA